MCILHKFFTIERKKGFIVAIYIYICCKKLKAKLWNWFAKKISMKMQSAKVQSKVPKGDCDGFSLNLKQLRNPI